MHRKHLNTVLPGLVTALSVALIALGTGCAVYSDVEPEDVQSEMASSSSTWNTPNMVADIHFDANALEVEPEPEPEPEPEQPEVGLCQDVLYPAANEPDGCRRRLVTVDNTGAPFNASSVEATMSRTGNLIAFTVLPTEEHGVNGLPQDTNLARDVYAVNTDPNDTTPLELVSVNELGEVGNGDSFEPSISGHGRFVAFTSYARNLTPDELNGFSAIYVRDRHTKTMELVSLSYDKELLPDGDSYRPLLSEDGRYVVFLSAASNLVPNDTNDRVDLFVRDRVKGSTMRISLDANRNEVKRDALPAAGISTNGRYVLFSHPSPLTTDAVTGEGTSDSARIEAYRLDRLHGTLTLVSRRARGDSAKGARAVALSPDGSRALLQVGRIESLVGTGGAFGPGTVMARLDGELTFRQVKLGGGTPTGMNAGGEIVTFTSSRLGHVPSVQKLAEGIATDNAYVMDVDLGEATLLTAADNGVPAVIHDYNEPGVRDLDWVTAGVNDQGDRFVVSSIQYGMASHSALHCERYHPRMVYFVSCNPSDY